MKKFNKVMSIIGAIFMSLVILSICVIGINEIYYSLPGGMDTEIAWVLCIMAGGKIGTWTTNEVARIIKG